MSKAPPAPGTGGAGEEAPTGARFLAPTATPSASGVEKDAAPEQDVSDGKGARNRAPAGAMIERRVVAALIAFTLLVSTLPYALGYFLAPVMGPQGTTFIGTPYNIDDYCNYLSWLRQMADGRFFLHNMFTTDPQNDLEFNVFFWVLGRVVALTRCSPQAALQGARLVGGGLLLWLISRFYRLCLPADRHARLAAFGFACLSSGVGWVQWRHWHDKNLPGGPVDAWQPEAYTFLSVYTSALMTVGTVFIVGALYALLRGEQTGRMRYAVYAGLCGGILGNMHSYDVLHLSAAWGLFLVVWTVLKRGRGVALSWARAAVALALTLPTTLYMYHVFNAEAVFKARAEVPTLSPGIPLIWHGHPVIWHGHSVLLPAPWHYFLGYGLVFLLAVVAGYMLVKAVPPPASRDAEDGKEMEGTLPMVFALCWAVGGLLVCYLPFAFQRKMLMGEHVPLCLLAGVGAAWLARRYAPRAQVLALALLVLAAAPSNALFLLRDMRHLETDHSETHLFPFLPADLVDVYRWLRASTPAEAAVVGPPGYCTYLPGEAGRVVWAGHWAETPHYGLKDAEFADAFDRLAPEEARHRFLLSTKATYLFYPNEITPTDTFKRRDGLHRWVELTQAPPPYLREVYKNGTFTVYEIR